MINNSRHIRVVVIDDDEDCVNLLVSLLRRHSKIEICGQALNYSEGFDLILKNKPDLALLDIRMDGKDGIQLATEIDKYCQTKFIFVSGETNRGPDALNLQPFDFLHKPFTQKALYNCIDNFIRHRETELNNQPDDNLDKMVVFNSVSKKNYITLSDLIYLKGDRNYSILFCQQREEPISKNLKIIHQNLPQKYFVRIHKSYIINIKYLEKVDKANRMVIIKRSGVLVSLPCSLSYMKPLMEHLDKYKLI